MTGRNELKANVVTYIEVSMICVSQHSTVNTDILSGPTKHSCFQFRGLYDTLAPIADGPTLIS